MPIFILAIRSAISWSELQTDFVARTDAMKEFAHNVCMHIAAMKPLYISPADVDEKFLAAKKDDSIPNSWLSLVRQERFLRQLFKEN